jgi:nitrate reductase gamma subunit
VQELLEFAEGPLFRLSFIIMLLGLARIFFLDIYNAVEAYKKAGDKKLAWADAIKKTLRWIFPVKSAFTRRPIYSVISILFHIGLILVPVFLLAHIQLWKEGIGLSWWSLPPYWADFLTVLTISGALALFIGRVGSRGARLLSRKQDYLWPLILLIPFTTGYLCANVTVAPGMYSFMMLVHVLSGNLIFILLPFTKLAHCVLIPLSQFIIALAWKFPARVDENICTSLNKKGAPV